MNRIEMIFRADVFRAEQIEGRSLPDLVGHAIVYNIIGDGGDFTEEILPGAASDEIRNNADVLSLFNHNPSALLGRTPDSLQLSEDDTGLWTRTSPVDSSVARDVVAWVSRGLVKHMSFAFKPTDEDVDWSNKYKPHFRIKKIRLFDVSAVTFPFYKQTDISVERAAADRKEELALRLSRAKVPEEQIRETLARAEKERLDRAIQLTRMRFLL